MRGNFLCTDFWGTTDLLYIFAGVDRTKGRKRQGEKEGAANVQGQRLRQSQHQAASGRRRQRGISHQAQKRR